MGERHTKQNDFHGQTGRRSYATRGGVAHVGSADTIAGPGCWCGLSYGHRWPGIDDGVPHPPADAIRELRSGRPLSATSQVRLVAWIDELYPEGRP